MHVTGHRILNVDVALEDETRRLYPCLPGVDECPLHSDE